MSEEKLVPKLRFLCFDSPWKTYSLNEFLTFFSTNSFSRSDLNYKNGLVKNIHYGDIHKNYLNILDCENNSDIPYINENKDLSKFKSENYCQNGDIIIADASEDYNDIGKAIELTNVQNEKILAGLHTILGRDNKNLTVEGFKSYLFLTHTLKTQIKRISNGISVLGISKKNLGKLKVNIPLKEEQQKIVSFLNNVTKKIELLKRKHEFYILFKKWLLQKIFSKSDKLQFANLGCNYETKRVGDFLIESKISGIDDINKRLTVKLNLKGIFPRETSTVEKEGSTKQYIRKSGQFIYGKQNLFKGAFGIIPKYLDGYLSSSDLPSFDFKENINPNWFLYYFSRENFYQKLENLATGTGSKRISPDDFLKIKILIPSLEEQEKIANFLSAVDKKIDLIQSQIQKMETFKKGLLQQMFILNLKFNCF